MSEPIMELVEAYATAIREDERGLGFEWDLQRMRYISAFGNTHAAIEQAVAELRAQAEAVDLFQQSAESSMRAMLMMEQRIADLEAENVALMEAGKVACNMVVHHDVTQREEYRRAARAVFTGQPGALENWIAREGE